jgi:hypothetical protein
VANTYDVARGRYDVLKGVGFSIFKQTTSSDDANAFKSGKNDEIPGKKLFYQLDRTYYE